MTSSDHAPLAQMDNRPGSHLVWVAPHSPERTDVFGKPDEETSQYKTENQRHLPIPVEWPKDHHGARVQS